MHTCIIPNLWLSRWMEEDVENSESVKKTKQNNMIQAASGGNKLLQRLCSNLHLQPSLEWGAAKQPSAVCRVSAFGLLSCRATQRGSKAGAAVVYLDVFSLWIVGGPRRRACQGMGWRAADPGSVSNRLKRGLSRLFFDTATGDFSHPASCLPLTRFYCIFFLNFPSTVDGALVQEVNPF